MPSKLSPEGFGRYIWASDAKEGYVLGKLCDIFPENMTVQLVNTKKMVTVAYEQVFPAEEDQSKDVDDNCALMYLNEATFLHNCRLRYARKKIYSYVSNILICINPYEQVPELYSNEVIRKYRGRSLGTLPPHIFAIADKAYRDMRRFKESESIIVSGESGAGKTESQKLILRYLCECWSSGSGSIEKKILETNPILEAFGNAKTLRNNNSSRFGKFVEIHFNQKYTVAGGYISHYLLEKSRICMQQKCERNYHIFYQLIAGAGNTLASELGLSRIDEFNYLNKGCTQYFSNPGTRSKISKDRRGSEKGDLHDELLDDYADFIALNEALVGIGVTAKNIKAIFQTVAAVLHLGNILFEETLDDSAESCTVTECSENALIVAAKLLGLDSTELRSGLLFRVLQPAKGGDKETVIRVPLKPQEAAAARDALAKAIYSKIFDWIVMTINRSIPFGDSISYIGVLDIAGFEFFTINSFEQFCINYCNEKLQKFFSDRILKHEQELYASEYLNVQQIEYSDNQDCIELFEDKTNGLLVLLDEEARLPRPSSKHFAAQAHLQQNNNFRLDTPRHSKLREHREMLDDEGFLIRHFAGSVCYDTRQFLEKNNDALHMSLEMLIQQSDNEYIRNLFSTNDIPERTCHREPMGKLTSASISHKFRLQLEQLLERLKNTGTHFVRCVKPNSNMQAVKFDGVQILSQLKCAGMTSVLKLMQNGYPSRIKFADLHNMYKALLPAELIRLDSRLFYKCLFGALGLNDNDFKFGVTKVFFKSGKFAEFDELLHQDREQMKRLIRKVQSRLQHIRWKKAQYGVLCCVKLQNKIRYRANALITIQSAIRGYIVRRQQIPRIECYKRLLVLDVTADDLLKIMNNSTKNLQNKWSSTVSKLKQKAVQLISVLKDTNNVNLKKIDAQCRELQSTIEKTTAALSAEMAEQENVRLKMIENKLKEEEAQKLRDNRRRDLRKQKEEWQMLEERRIEETKLYLANEAFIEEQRRIEKELQQNRARKAEQERLDAELVRRLIEEDQNVHILDNDHFDSASTIPKTKYDLSRLKYPELRDLINTSNAVFKTAKENLDIELITACRDEFYQRLQAYQRWKQNTGKRGNNHSRAPSSVFKAAETPLVPSSQFSNQNKNIQRYFKVPFDRPIDQGSSVNESRKGLWYAHFDGQWIARQMEIRPNKQPLLLVAGRDDIDMCEIPLEKTQLTRKKGAEILADEFESLWRAYGGPPYHLGLAPSRKLRDST